MSRANAGSIPAGHPKFGVSNMSQYELKRFSRLVEGLNLPLNRRRATVANMRWILRNAWIQHHQDPRFHELMDLCRPYI